MTTATHQNENGKGKEIQRPRTPERQLQEKMGKKPRPDYLKRRFYEGKWYCDCENWTLPAHYRSITNVFNENYGKPCESTSPLYFQMPHLKIPQLDTSAKFGHVVIQLNDVASLFGSMKKKMRNGD